MFPIVFSVQRSPGSGDCPSPELVKHVLTRDNHVCRFCGLEDEQNEIVSDAKSANMEHAATADIFCASCHDLEKVKRGTMLYLPEVESADFHHLLRTVYLVMALGTPEDQEEAEEVLEQLLALSKPVEVCWGTTKASEFGRILRSAPDAAYNKRQRVFDGLLLLLHPSCLPRGTIGSWAQRLRKKGLGSLKAWKMVFDGHFSGKIENDDN